MLPKHFNTMLIIFIIIIITAVNAQWKKLNSGIKANLTGVALIDSNSAIVVGEKGTILKTTDSGKSWFKIDLNIDNNLNAISNRYQFFLSKNSSIIAGDSILLISSDNGETWLIKNEPYNFTSIDQGFTTPLRRAIPGLASNPDSSIVLGTEGGRIVYSTDKGNTWQDTLLLDLKIIAVNFDLYGLVPLGSGTTFKVLAASSSKYVEGNIFNNEWEKYDIGIYVPWQNIISGDFAYIYKFLVGDGGEIASTPLLLRREENDSAWTNISQNLPIGLFPNKIKNFGSAVFICGTYGKIFRSSDNGDEWTEQLTPVNTKLNDISFLTSFSFYNSDIGYAVGESGTILYTSNGGITSVERNSNNQPAEFKLYQNYPNPFNPGTVIKYTIPKEGRVRLIIYNVLGEEVKALVNSSQGPGKYSVEFSSRNLASGIYFYEIKFNNSTLSKKMLLLK
jgi:photosystem II stability/assembly factor-like uncharacterized protein